MKSLCRWRFIAVTACLIACAAMPLAAEKFIFKFQEGQKYRLISEVKQLHSVNGKAYRTDQLNRAIIEVSKVDANHAWHEVEYQNSREMLYPFEPYQFDRLYQSEFWRDKSGNDTISPEFFIPTTRNIPIFPDKDLQIGDTWTFLGSEVQDFRGIGIPEPFKYSFPVSYEYKGKIKWQEKEYDLIAINYQVFHLVKQAWPNSKLSPKIMGGFSKQQLYWDQVSGRPVYYSEEYYFQMVFEQDYTMTWEGTATARFEDIVPFDTKKATDDVQKKLDELNLKNVKVREDDTGVTISIENIQFAPDSPELMPAEKAKLDKISKILAQFPDRPLLITGHTALAGTEEGRQKLSEQRAQSVGQYLLDHKVRPRDSLQYLGKGATEPLGDNDSEAGRARNRRVEITILKE